jgi:WD40 repeat protein
MELEHAIGFSGTTKGGLHIHPSGDTVIYAQGGCVLIASLKDAHEQGFLRGHDDAVTCIDLSESGRLIASGQRGDNADVVVWDYDTRAEVYRLQEHDGGVNEVLFSSDERFLLTIGRDKKMVVWDMESGMIVSKTQKLKQMPECAVWGGRARNVKGRQTTSYQLATGGAAQLTYWTLDPALGSLTAEECTLGNQVRNFTALAFSYDEAYLLAGSSSSDFTAVHVKHKVLHSTTVCGSGGVSTILALRAPDGGSGREGDLIMVGCGDGSITVLESQRDGAMTCRTYTKGPTETCAAMLDGGVGAMKLHALDERSGELRLLAGTEKGTLYALSLSSPSMAYGAPAAQARVLQEAHYDKVTSCAYPKESSDLFATASADGTVRVWDVNTYRVLSSGYCQTQITCVA